MAACVESTWHGLLAESMREVFGMMLEGSEPLARGAADPQRMVTAVVGLAGAFNGMVVLRADEATARSVAAALLGMPPSSEDEVMDAVGEVCNMLTGNWKGKVPELAFDCHLSPPATVVGEHMRVHTGCGRGEVLQTHVSRHGSVDFMLCVKAEGDAARHGF